MPSDWTLIYQTDASGTPIFGSLYGLKTAVLHGADVKVIYRTGGGVWWSRYCNSVTVRGSGSRTVISATFMEAADTVFTGSIVDFEKNPFALEYHIYNSSGVRAFVKLHYQEHQIIQEDQSILPIKWYVKDYTVPWFVRPDAIFEWELIRAFQEGDDEEKGAG